VFNHVNAATYILAQLGDKKGEKDLSEDMILDKHAILTCGIDTESTAWQEYSGKYRKCPMQAGFHQFLHEERVPPAMRQMIQDYNADTLKAMKNGEIDPIVLSAKYCHIFVNIHPFEDGNGQMCRLILNAILFKHTCCLVAFGQNEIDRETYRHIAADASCR
jgi:Fic family protein